MIEGASKTNEVEDNLNQESGKLCENEEEKKDQNNEEDAISSSQRETSTGKEEVEAPKANVISDEDRGMLPREEKHVSSTLDRLADQPQVTS